MSQILRREKYSPIITCDGETEKWYFEHLQKLINADEKRCKDANFSPIVAQKPFKTSKSKTILYDTPWFHITDTETQRESDIVSFHRILEELNMIKMNKKEAIITLGYSNVSFELWLLLHKICTVQNIENAHGYWENIKVAFQLKKIHSFQDYKKERVFARVLEKINLSDVRFAIRNARSIELQLRQVVNPVRFCGFEYFADNPSTSLHYVVDEILNQCFN